MKTFTTIYFWNNPLKIHTEALILYSLSFEVADEVRSVDDAPTLELSLFITLIFELGVFDFTSTGICSIGDEGVRGEGVDMEGEREGGS